MNLFYIMYFAIISSDFLWMNKLINLFYCYFFVYLLLDDSPAFWISCEYIYMFRGNTLTWNLIYGFRKDLIDCKLVFTLWLRYFFLFIVSKILTLLNDILPVCFLKTRLFWPDRFACQISWFLNRVVSWKILLFGRRAWSITEVWYLSRFLDKIPWLKGLVCL